MQGKGYPDVNSRLLVRRLSDLFRIPVFVFTDCDAHGIEVSGDHRMHVIIYNNQRLVITVKRCYLLLLVVFCTI